MALRIWNLRSPISQVLKVVDKKKLLAPNNRLEIINRKYRNFSYGDYKMRTSEKVYIYSIPLVVIGVFIDYEKLKKFIKGEEIQSNYTIDELHNVFPNAELVVTHADKYPIVTHEQNVGADEPLNIHL